MYSRNSFPIFRKHRGITMLVSLTIAIFLAFMVSPAAADPAECKSIQHYLSDYDTPKTLKYVHFENDDADAVLATLTAMGMKPPIDPAHYVFITSSSVTTASVIAIFDENGCFMANARIPSHRMKIILEMTFPEREFPISLVTKSRAA